MKALIILAHGSRRSESNQEIEILTNEVKKIAEHEYDIIEHAYLELAEPSLLQAIEISMKNGASDITVMPYFLNSGNHVTRDIPTIIETATKKYPNCKFKVSACIGMFEDMPRLVLEQARLS